MKRIILPGLLSILVSGCAASSATKESVHTARAPVNYKQIIKTQVGNTLNDPYSAKFVIGEPVKANLCWGSYWKIPFTLNQKNLLNAYTGIKKYDAHFSNEKFLGVNSCKGGTVASHQRSVNALSRALKKL